VRYAATLMLIKRCQDQDASLLGNPQPDLLEYLFNLKALTEDETNAVTTFYEAKDGSKPRPTFLSDFAQYTPSFSRETFTDNFLQFQVHLFPHSSRNLTQTQTFTPHPLNPFPHPNRTLTPTSSHLIFTSATPNPTVKAPFNILTFV
jgi:hypothetical protein